MLTVWELTRYVKELIDGDELLSDIWVRGEISNFKHHSSGHMYFTLKDERAAIRCVMFRTQNAGLAFRPADGMRMLVGGRVSVFERDGQYQLYVRRLEPEGIGSLYLAFEQLRSRLEAEGLFDEVRKRKIPLLPRRIGVVTSLTGAAVRDIITVIRRRNPGARLVICPSLVQGPEAPRQLIKGLELLNSLPDVDVIILARGGGSFEELWAFNDEALARAIRASRVPVISGVGHQTDFTIADLAADLRAATPSAAAERAVPDRGELRHRMESLRARLRGVLRTRLERERRRLARLASSTALSRPFARLEQERQRLDGLSRDLATAITLRLQAGRTRRDLGAQRLQALSPLATLDRGYTICLQPPGGQVMTSVRALREGALAQIIFRDGSATCNVVSRKEEGERGSGDPA